MKFLGFVSERAFSCGFLLLFSFLLLLLVGFLLVFWQFFFLLLLLVFSPFLDVALKVCSQKCSKKL